MPGGTIREFDTCKLISHDRGSFKNGATARICLDVSIVASRQVALV